MTDQRSRTAETGLPQPRRRPFNGFLLPKDPIDLVGVPLRAFDLNLLVPLEPETRPDQVNAFTRDLYVGVYHAMREGSLGSVEAEVADFDDIKVPGESARRQIRAVLSTSRRSRVTTLFRSYHNATQVYIAMDSFLLGALNWTALLVRTALAVAWIAFALTVMQALPVTFIVMAPLTLAVLVVLFARAIRGMRMYGLQLGLRGAFPKSVVASSFDSDDCLMFLKGLMPTTVRLIRDAAESNDIDIAFLEGPLVALEARYSVTTYANNGNGVMNVGGVMGDVVAGAGNTSSNGTGPT